ncbi:hypothetical protein EJB05_34791, partial [Eragrostis curvula]
MAPGSPIPICFASALLDSRAGRRSRGSAATGDSCDTADSIPNPKRPATVDFCSSSPQAAVTWILNSDRLILGRIRTVEQQGEEWKKMHEKGCSTEFPTGLRLLKRYDEGV